MKFEVTVNVEKTAHEALTEFAQTFYKQTGVRLQRVDFDWAANVSVTNNAAEYVASSATVTSVA